jgi:hypothetical protein
MVVFWVVVPCSSLAVYADISEEYTAFGNVGIEPEDHNLYSLICENIKSYV